MPKFDPLTRLMNCRNYLRERYRHKMSSSHESRMERTYSRLPTASCSHDTVCVIRSANSVCPQLTDVRNKGGRSKIHWGWRTRGWLGLSFGGGLRSISSSPKSSTPTSCHVNKLNAIGSVVQSCVQVRCGEVQLYEVGPGPSYLG